MSDSSPHSNPGVWAKIERGLERLDTRLSNWALVGLLDKLGKFSILVVVIIWIAGFPARRKQAVRQAWTTVAILRSGQGAGRAGGVKEAVEFLHAMGEPLNYLDAQGAALQNAQLGGAELRHAFLGQRQAANGGSDPILTNLRNADFTDADLTGADLSSATLAEANLKGADFNGATLIETDFENAEIGNADFTGANMRYAKLGGCTRLNEATFDGTDLEGADFGDPESDARIDLAGAVFRGTVLTQVNFWYAILRRVDFTNATLSHCDFSDADLAEAILTGADLTGADLRGADFDGANLEGADLEGAIVDNPGWLQEYNLDQDKWRIVEEGDEDGNRVFIVRAVPHDDLD